MKTFLAAAAASVLAFAASAADAATFVFKASTHDVWNGELVAFDTVLTTDDGVAGATGLTYTVLSGTGDAIYDGTSPVTSARGSFTLDGNVIRAVDVFFVAQGNYGDQFGVVTVDPADHSNDRVFLTEVGGGVEHLEITPQVNGVPEPATWAMMVFGFGAAGFVLRRRGRATARIRFA